MRCGSGETDIEALEWGGLLHDVGKIGVPDNVLLKQERLNREERMSMNSHPVLGAQIIAPVTRLSRELPIIRHHHEWYNGSGYPDRLIGDEIPLLARVLHVADAFEAMTAARPYRMTPLTEEQALGELRKFAGIQFDPRIVDAFVKTHWVDGVRGSRADGGGPLDPADRGARGIGRGRLERGGRGDTRRCAAARRDAGGRRPDAGRNPAGLSAAARPARRAGPPLPTGRSPAGPGVPKQASAPYPGNAHGGKLPGTRRRVDGRARSSGARGLHPLT